MPVFLSDEQDHDVDADDLVALARHVLAQERVPAEMELGLLLVDTDAIAALNERHLGEAGPTDVLAFPIDDPSEMTGEAPAVLGDVVLCPGVAAEQATRVGRAPADELRLLTVHGILHLLGMDHDTPEAEQDMFEHTEQLVRGYAQEHTTS